jgi:hypothetical protein
MLRLTSLLAMLCVTIGFSLMAGCGGQTPPPAAEEHGDHDHEHGDHDHEHGEHEHGDHAHEGEAGHEHGHSSTGPNGGHLIELGEEDYHAELVHDDYQPSVSLYLLDAQARSPVVTATKEMLLNVLVNGAPQQFKLMAAPLSGEKDGSASRFHSTDESLWRLISDESKLSGRFNVSIGGKQFVGQFDHAPHGEHAGDHKHDQADTRSRAAR